MKRRTSTSLAFRARPTSCLVAAILVVIAVWSPRAIADDISASSSLREEAEYSSVRNLPTLPHDPALADYVAYAREMSASLRGAEAAVRAADEHSAMVGALPDPMLTYGHFIDEVETRVGPQEERIGVRQTLPWFGKLSLRKASARSVADAARERLRDEGLKLVADVTAAYSEYAYLTRAVAISEERVALLMRLENVVRTEYSGGTGAYADVMKSQIALARAESDLEALRDLRGPLSERLRAVVNIEDEGLLPWPPGIPVLEKPPPAEEARAAFAGSNPELGARALEVKAAEQRASLASREQFPDLTLGLDYIVTGEASMPVDESGKDPLVAVASLNLPIWFGARRAAVREAEANVSRAERRSEHTAKMLAAELEMALYDVADSTRRIELYEDQLVPMARQSLSSVEASYRAGGSDFDSLVAADAALLEFELALSRARADCARSIVDLNRLIGRETTFTRGDRGAHEEENP
jgi:cobalt-zinc-cadmium efflux system outer membrane protein